MFCHKCGHELPENSEFCPKCGSPLTLEKIPITNTPPKTEPKKPQYFPESTKKIPGGFHVITDDMLKDGKFKAILKFGVSNSVATAVAIILEFVLYLNGMMDEIYYDIIVDRWNGHFVFMAIAILLTAIAFGIAYLISKKELDSEIGGSVIIAKTILRRVFVFWEKPISTDDFAKNYANEFMDTQMKNLFRMSMYSVAISIFLCILPHFIK